MLCGLDRRETETKAAVTAVRAPPREKPVRRILTSGPQERPSTSSSLCGLPHGFRNEEGVFEMWIVPHRPTSSSRGGSPTGTSMS